jgi:triphosphatase
VSKTRERTSAQHEPIETELKLTLPPEGACRLADHPAFGPPCASAPRSVRIVSTYFDTPSHELARRGLSLRVRTAGPRRVQTLKSSDPKSSAHGGAAMSRGEWEWPLKDDKPDLDLAAGNPVARRLPPNVGKRLRPMVVTDVVRTARTLDFQGSTIEAALDSGSIVAGDSKQLIHELELELRSGASAALYGLALSLHAVTPLSIEVESKAARGYRLVERSAPTARKHTSIELDSDVVAGDGLRLIVGEILSHLLANKSAALAGDAEGVHQVRIAIRRLRTALRLFAPRLEPHSTAAFQTKLQRMGQIIGDARDWDVFSLEALPMALGKVDELGWDLLLREAANARRQAAGAACAREVGGAEFTALVLGVAAWTQSGRERMDLLGDKSLKQPLSGISAVLLDRIADKVDKRGQRVGSETSAAELHPLRKSLKKLRYSLEFLSSLYPRKATKRYLQRLKKLQETLGAINDAAAALRLAEELAEDRIDLTIAVAAFAKTEEDASRDARRRLAKEWAAYRRQKRFWR